VKERAKKVVRTAWIQSLLAWAVSAYLDLTLATMRWRIENRGPVDAAVASPDGYIACFWHGRIALAVACRCVLKQKPRRVLISRSPDGEFIAKTVQRLSFPAIRASAGRSMRNSAAFRDAMRFIDAGGVVAVTPDGPRGPAEEMPIGPVMMARVRGTPVFLCGLAATPSLTLKSWDKTKVPLPFARGCMVFEGPLQVTRDESAASMETIRADWQDRLNAAQARAEALVGAR
jgi:lysophospholipid acyltransferase (LPLAT)-like uncharacterized protein